MLVPAADQPTAAEVLLQAVSLTIGATGSLPALSIDITVGPGELHLVYSRERDRSSDIADGLLGLDEAQAGMVCFLRKVWSDLTRREALSLRRCVGRVQSHGNWMDSRSVMENILLPARHHSVVPQEVLREWACELAQRFGLPGLPLQLPAECAPADLESAACVRAFLDRPTLVVLEHPIRFADSPLLPALINAIQQLRRRGGAAIWFTEHLALVRDISIPADRRYQIVGSRLLEVAYKR
jgi:phospholipid/cholesterol/gamma-HCH transport system ATP-binding protein